MLITDVCWKLIEKSAKCINMIPAVEVQPSGLARYLYQSFLSTLKKYNEITYFNATSKRSAA